jgi:type IV pilus assembly protein PilV
MPIMRALNSHPIMRAGRAVRQARRGQMRGVSLVEVLIVVLLFSVGLVGLMAMQARAFQFSVSAEDSGRAALMANELAAQMWAANTVNLPAAAVEAWQERVADSTRSGLPNSAASVSVDNGVARISIQWRAPRTPVGQESRYLTDVMLAAPAPPGP